MLFLNFRKLKYTGAQKNGPGLNLDKTEISLNCTYYMQLYASRQIFW